MLGLHQERRDVGAFGVKRSLVEAIHQHDHATDLLLLDCRLQRIAHRPAEGVFRLAVAQHQCVDVNTDDLAGVIVDLLLGMQRDRISAAAGNQRLGKARAGLGQLQGQVLGEGDRVNPVPVVRIAEVCRVNELLPDASESGGCFDLAPRNPKQLAHDRGLAGAGTALDDKKSGAVRILQPVGEPDEQPGTAGKVGGVPRDVVAEIDRLSHCMPHKAVQQKPVVSLRWSEASLLSGIEARTMNPADPVPRSSRMWMAPSPDPATNRSSRATAVITASPVNTASVKPVPGSTDGASYPTSPRELGGRRPTAQPR